MSYYRLRDIKTPPFAYVINTEEAKKVCEQCNLPFRELREPLKVEIFSTDVGNWEPLIIGKPLMAEYWLIGEQTFGACLESVLPGCFRRQPVKVASWLVRNPNRIMTGRSDQTSKGEVPLPQFFHFEPIAQLPIDPELIQKFPPIPCEVCRRNVPDIPFDYQVTPARIENPPAAASLSDFYFDGYDYLFHQSVVDKVCAAFPEMILEEQDDQPSLF